MSINLSTTVKYNADTCNIELDEGGQIIPISEDWYIINIYNCLPEASSHLPIKAAPLHGTRQGYEGMYKLMALRMIGTLKMSQFIEGINALAEVIGGV